MEHKAGPTARRVYSNTAMSGSCWEWQGALIKQGYGNISVDGRMVYTHRITLEDAVGPAPADKPFALHTCDNERCVRPDHLYWGTQAQNVADSIKRKRRHGIADWRPVDAMLAAGKSQRYVARWFGVSQAAISQHVRKQVIA